MKPQKLTLSTAAVMDLLREAFEPHLLWSGHPVMLSLADLFPAHLRRGAIKIGEG